MVEQGARPRRNKWPLYRLGYQVLLAVSLLLLWEFLPKIDALSERYKFLNEFFISSPGEVARKIRELTTASEGLSVWPYLRTTVTATVVGVIIGLSLGALAGLIFSNFRRIAEIVRPFIVLANSTPRIALIPIFVVITGPTVRASILNVTVVVFFLGFFNAFEGGSKISQPVLDNARLLGASSFALMRTIRLPQVMSWTFASVPNAISFGLIVAVATELIAGVQGMGRLLFTAMLNVDSGLTFAVMLILSVVGLLMYGVATLLRDVLLHWEKAS